MNRAPWKAGNDTGSPYISKGALRALLNSTGLQIHFSLLQIRFFPTPALFPSVGAEERVVQNSKARSPQCPKPQRGFMIPKGSSTCFGSHLSQSANIRSHLHIPGCGSLWKLKSMEKQNGSGRWFLRSLLQSSCFSCWDLGT